MQFNSAVSSSRAAFTANQCVQNNIENIIVATANSRRIQRCSEQHDRLLVQKSINTPQVKPLCIEKFFDSSNSHSVYFKRSSTMTHVLEGNTKVSIPIFRRVPRTQNYATVIEASVSMLVVQPIYTGFFTKKNV